MKNKEKFAKEILEVAWNHHNIAVKDGKPVPCADIRCDECIGCSPIGCREKIAEWVEQEYIEEPEVDWSKVPVDTKILVSGDGETWTRRYFAKYENDKVFAWFDGGTSWSNDSYKPSYWKYAKLAEPLEEEKPFWHKIIKNDHQTVVLGSDEYPEDGERIILLDGGGNIYLYWYSRERDKHFEGFAHIKAWARIPEFE